MPTFFFVYFLVGLLAISFADLDFNKDAEAMKIFFGASFVIGLLVTWKTFFKLRRIDIDDNYVYVSDYFKTAKYEYNAIEYIKETSTLGKKWVTIKLKGKGIFGDKIIFLPNKIRYRDYFRARLVED